MKAPSSSDWAGSDSQESGTPARWRERLRCRLVPVSSPARSAPLVRSAPGLGDVLQMTEQVHRWTQGFVIPLPVVNRKERTSHLDWITEHWDRIGQFFAAFASGQTTASVALKRLVGHGPKNRFYRATRELGRVFKSEFILDYLSQPALRTRIRRGLLKGEQLHALARCVHYGRLGRLDQRDFERQTGAASCLLLILAAIIHWQIREIDRVLSETGSDADDLNFELLFHISPIGWDNVLLYGEYQLNRSLVRSERLSV